MQHSGELFLLLLQLFRGVLSVLGGEIVIWFFFGGGGRVCLGLDLCLFSYVAGDAGIN